jgi:hypothetical protein
MIIIYKDYAMSGPVETRDCVVSAVIDPKIENKLYDQYEYIYTDCEDPSEFFGHETKSRIGKLIENIREFSISRYNCKKVFVDGNYNISEVK